VLSAPPALPAPPVRLTIPALPVSPVPPNPQAAKKVFKYYKQKTDTPGQQISIVKQPPPTYLWMGILTTIFCCMPFGIVSIVYASKVNGKFAAGNILGAKESSEEAKSWAIYAFGSFFLMILIRIFLFAFRQYQ